MTRRPPHAWHLPAEDVAHLARLGYPYCDRSRCEAPPAWVIWHWWTRHGQAMAAEVFLCDAHTAAYRRRRPDIEIRAC